MPVGHDLTQPFRLGLVTSLIVPQVVDYLRSLEEITVMRCLMLLGNADVGNLKNPAAYFMGLLRNEQINPSRGGQSISRLHRAHLLLRYLIVAGERAAMILNGTS